MRRFLTLLASLLILPTTLIADNKPATSRAEAEVRDAINKYDDALRKGDPAAVEGSKAQVDRAFLDAFTILDRRINLFLALPLSSLDKLAIKKGIEQIGHE